MPQRKNNNIIHIGNLAFPVRRIATILLIGVIVFALSYVYLLASTTMNVTMRKSLQQDTRELQSDIAELEADYLVQRSGLTLNEAYERGFVESEKQAFAYRHETSESLALGVE